MASAIEDVSSLPGETLKDQDGRKIGEIKEIYAVGENETPMWVTVESQTGLGRSKRLFVPLARIKQQNDEIRVPYSFDHLHEAPDVEGEDELSEEDDKALRDYYAVGLADQEMVDNRQSYASQVPDEGGPAKQIDGDSAQGPVRELDERPTGERAAEAYEKRQEESDDEEHEKGRKATAADVMDEDGSDETSSKSDEKSSDSGEKSSDSGEKSSDSGEKSSDSGEKSSDSGEKSSDSGEKSSDSGEKSSDSGEKSSDSGEETADSEDDESDEKDEATEGQPAASGESRSAQG